MRMTILESKNERRKVMMRKVLFRAAVLLVGLTLLMVPAQADPGYDPAYDIDRNGEINVVDIMLVAAHWRETGTWTDFCTGAPSPVPKTGAGEIYINSYTLQAGEDGLLQKGVAWPDPRFTDNSDGTVTDNLTGLIWLKDANCRDTVGGINRSDFSGSLLWANALTWSNNLANGDCGLSDGSTAGQWRLPNVRELFSLIDWGEMFEPALTSGHPFDNVQGHHWSSTTKPTTWAWTVNLGDGYVAFVGKANHRYVWPVRGGQ